MLPILPPFYKMKVAEQDGSMSSEASLYNDEQSQTLVKAIDVLNMQASTEIDNTGAVSYTGLVPPSLTNAQITALAPTAALGTIWFNTDAAKLNVCTAPGVVQTISSA